jgi:hypothetical protein
MKRATQLLAAAALTLTLASGCATPAEGPGALAALENPRASIALSLSVEPGLRVNAGEVMTISVAPSAPVYVNVFMFNESGRTFQLARDVFASPASPLVLPPPGADYVLQAMEPAGVDQLVVVATRQALMPSAAFVPGPENAPRELATSQVNTLSDLRTRLASVPARDWASAGEQITVAARAPR